ncbi:TIGR01841 family phasin [uncultured Ferrovibrio sp.]|jgi:phasin family protein|uniref:phasin family protein n=1 Tax=uncultured Ferrovibrio sp. TaxID=1576913 RepID=UPI002611A29B|nr:TIGR01841 family phasin [uncultured Ferrovibrio sp.]
MKTTENPFAAFDFTKMFGDLKVPGFDPASLAAAQQRNIDAIAAANKRALEGYQALVKRQAEMFQETMQEIARMMKESVGTGAPDANLTKQAEMLRQAVEKALANMRELTEMASKTNSEAFETVQRRLQENLEEIKNSFAQAKKK